MKTQIPLSQPLPSDSEAPEAYADTDVEKLSFHLLSP